MNEANQTSIKSAYPDLFRISRSNPTAIQYRGIECGDGWLEIVQQFCADITAIAANDGLTINTENYPKFLQIKEKFGNLRIYMNLAGLSSAGLDLARDKIFQAEGSSLGVCERCGEPGELRKSSWWHVKCDACETLAATMDKGNR